MNCRHSYQHYWIYGDYLGIILKCCKDCKPTGLRLPLHHHCKCDTCLITPLGNLRKIITICILVIIFTYLFVILATGVNKFSMFFIPIIPLMIIYANLMLRLAL